MSDQDYIRKAVELADGWRWAGDTWYGPMLICDTRIDTLLEDKWRFLLDALAAQLVRQVDTLREPDMRIIYFMVDGVGKAMVHDMTKLDFKVGECDGTDRTMNTIKAIVDSKVLEQKHE